MVAEILPTAEESKLLAEYSGDVGALDRPEQLLRSLAAIPRLEGRLKCMMFKAQLEVEMDGLLMQQVVACLCIGSSRQMHAWCSKRNSLYACLCLCLCLYLHLYLCVHPQVDELKEACRLVRESRELHALLQIVLDVGNALNAGTAKGNAVGFRLSTLLKLAEVKASDKKTTLLHFVVRVVRENAPTITHEV